MTDDKKEQAGSQEILDELRTKIADWADKYETLSLQYQLIRRDLMLHVEKQLAPGSIIDVTQLGIAYNAAVIRGRAYGSRFRVRGLLSVDLSLNPSQVKVARWQAQAISVNDIDAEKGNPVILKGYIFHDAIYGYSKI